MLQCLNFPSSLPGYPFPELPHPPLSPFLTPGSPPGPALSHAPASELQCEQRLVKMER